MPKQYETLKMSPVTWSPSGASKKARRPPSKNKQICFLAVSNQHETKTARGGRHAHHLVNPCEKQEVLRTSCRMLPQSFSTKTVSIRRRVSLTHKFQDEMGHSSTEFTRGGRSIPPTRLSDHTDRPGNPSPPAKQAHCVGVLQSCMPLGCAWIRGNLQS